MVTGGVVYGLQQGRIVSCSERLGQARQDLRQVSQHARDLESEVALLREYPPDANIPPDFLAVYGSTVDEPDRPVVEYYVAASRNLPVLQKLRILASTLSRQRFSELPINVVGIDAVDGRQVAVIDLRELHEGFEHPTWRAGYFQGSTGGGITQTALTDTFLQRDYQGDWVDGVRFLYQGKPMLEGEWDHINLSGIIYR